jgi:hypothetical protein
METTRKKPIVPHGTRLPPPRPGTRYLPVAWVGIIVADDRVRRRVDRFFHWPMIVLAIAVLPLLALDAMGQARDITWLRHAVGIGFAIIWTAFLIEFIVKISIAEARVEYVRRNWLDIVVIVLPILRVFRAGTAVARTSKAFRLRGVGMKFARYVFTILVGMEATERMLQRIGVKLRDDRPDPDRMTRYQLIDEVKKMRRLNDAWEAWHEAHEAHVEEHGGPCTAAPPPSGEDADDSRPAQDPARA